MMDAVEIELIQRAQEGDVNSFEALVLRHDQRILRIAYNMLGNIQDARDIYQDVFLRAFENISFFKFNSTFSTWLHRIAINQCINRIRQRRFKSVFFSKPGHNQLEWDIDDLASPDQNPEQETISQELQQQIQQSLESLTGHQRAVFILKHQQGYKIAEIAKILNCAEGTVKKLLFKAVHKLRKKLKPYIY